MNHEVMHLQAKQRCLIHVVHIIVMHAGITSPVSLSMNDSLFWGNHVIVVSWHWCVEGHALGSVHRCDYNCWTPLYDQLTRNVSDLGS